MAGSQAEPVNQAASAIRIRLLTEHAEFAEAVQLQRDIWGFADVDLLPVRLFVVASKIGGHVFGAFDGARMIGFCLGIPGLKAGGKHYLHSHMLGVQDAYRNLGVGRMLKLAQREQVLSLGVDLIEWTFDPLEIRNAYFNIERLGAVVNRYVLNQYGYSTSKLHGGLPTDRCVAEWHLDTDRVRALLSGAALPRPVIRERVQAPASIARLRSEDPSAARAIQRDIGERFQQYFAAGLTVVGLDRSGDGGTYLLSDKWPSE
jgi:predicted GNAT superfamily acetyltransferase